MKHIQHWEVVAYKVYIPTEKFTFPIFYQEKDEKDQKMIPVLHIKYEEKTKQKNPDF